MASSFDGFKDKAKQAVEDQGHEWRDEYDDQVDQFQADLEDWLNAVPRKDAVDVEFDWEWRPR